MQEMKAVSDIWLNGRKEKGFSLGFFDEAYLQQAPIAIVESKEGEIVAFANIMPTQNKRVATIDLMRYDFKRLLKASWTTFCQTLPILQRRRQAIL